MLQMEEKLRQKLCIFAFLSYNQLKEYLSILIENNLIEYLDGTNKFKTTEKGLKYLKMHNEIGELLQQLLQSEMTNELIFFDFNLL